MSNFPINYYSVLESPKNSNPIDIRKSYKRLSLKLHPDKNDAPNAQELFEGLKIIYDVLNY